MKKTTPLATIPGVKVTSNDDGTLMLEQAWPGGVDRVEVHPVDLRYMIDRMGLVPVPSASNARVVREIEKMKRRLLVLKPRIDYFGKCMPRGGPTHEAGRTGAAA